MILLNCLICDKKFRTFPKVIEKGGGKFCSRVCYWKSKLGKKLSEEARMKGKEAITGERNYLWKGDKVGYHGLHIWVTRHLGRPDTCEHCGKSGLTSRKAHWANKSHNYLRDLTDWLRLCVPCHRKYDASIS